MEFRQLLELSAGSLGDLWASLAAYLPRVLGALLTVAVGWIVALLLRLLVRQVVARIERFVHKLTGGEEAREQNVGSRIASAFVFWLVLLLFIAAAVEQLGLRVVGEGLAAIAIYLPAALGAVIIVLLAFLFGDFVKRGVGSAARASGLSHAELLGESAKVLLFVIAAVLALDQLRVDSTILVVLSATLLAGLIGGATLAFGLGARTTVSNILASHYVQQIYQTGQKVRVEGITGRIVEIRPTTVVIDTAEGRAAVPTKIFSESVSALVPEED